MCRHPNVEENEDKSYAEFKEKQFTEFSKKFQAKEKAIAKLVDDLQSISKSMYVMIPSC